MSDWAFNFRDIPTGDLASALDALQRFQASPAGGLFVEILERHKKAEIANMRAGYHGTDDVSRLLGIQAEARYDMLDLLGKPGLGLKDRLQIEIANRARGK